VKDEEGIGKGKKSLKEIWDGRQSGMTTSQASTRKGGKKERRDIVT